MKKSGKNVMALVINNNERYVINAKDEKYRIRKFSVLVLGEDSICECYSEKRIPNSRIKIIFNHKKLKGVIETDNGMEKLISSLFMIWQDGESSSFKGLFLMQRKPGKFGITFWQSFGGWDEEESHIHGSLFQLFCTLTELPASCEEAKKRLIEQIKREDKYEEEKVE